MSAAHELRALLTGVRPTDGLLQTLRLETAGAEFYGEEAVLERGRAAPLELVDAVEVRGSAQLALFGARAAAVADTFGERVGRVWAVGATLPAAVEPAVAVPFDPDLRQTRGGVFWSAADHPDAHPSLLARLATAGERLAEPAAEARAYRLRAMLIRAFGTETQGVGLFALHRLGPGPVRTSMWIYAAVLVDGAGERWVSDRAGEAACGPAYARL